MEVFDILYLFLSLYSKFAIQIAFLFCSYQIPINQNWEDNPLKGERNVPFILVPQKRIEWGGTFENAYKNMVKFMYPLTLYPKWGISEAKSEGAYFTAYIDLNLSIFSWNIKYFTWISYLKSELSPGFPWKKKFPDGI